MVSTPDKQCFSWLQKLAAANSKQLQGIYYKLVYILTLRTCENISLRVG